MKFKICVVGCGHMSSLVHGPSFKEYAKRNSDTILAGCCDLMQEKAELYREKFGFERAYTDYDEMFEKEKPDAVCLISNVLKTREMAVDIIKRGFPVMMEKPPGLTAAECSEIIEASRKYKTPARVAFNRRYQPLMQELKAMLKAQTLKDGIFNIYYNMIRHNRFEDDFSTTTIHAIDTVRYLADSDYDNKSIKYQYLPENGNKFANIYIDGVMDSGAIIRMEFLIAGGAEIERCIINSRNNTFLLNTPLGTDVPGKLTHITDKKIVNRIRGEEAGGFYINGGFYEENAQFFDLVKSGGSVGDVESGLQAVIITECIRKREEYYNFRRPERLDNTYGKGWNTSHEKDFNSAGFISDNSVNAVGGNISAG